MSGASRIVVDRPGGPEALRLTPVAISDPGPGEVRIATRAIGVNFIDVYHRTGLYPLSLPSGIGGEAAGFVETIGNGVEPSIVGSRVAVLTPKPGAYATHLIVPAERIVALPASVSDDVGAGALLKGLTAWMLVERIARAGPGSTLLVHSAAGGVGSIVVQWLKAIGATVLAHAGTPEKATRARALGADHALCVPLDQLGDAIRSLTGGRGVDVVLDGVGAASWCASLASVAKRGLIVSYGNASGPVAPVAPRELLLAGSIFLTRPTVGDYTATTTELHEGAERLFSLIESGAIRIDIGNRYPLADAAEAHRVLEARQTTGSTILIP